MTKLFRVVDCVDLPYDITGTAPPEDDPTLREIDNIVLLAQRQLDGPLALSTTVARDSRRFFEHGTIIALDISTFPPGTRLTPLKRALGRFPIFLINATSEMGPERVLLLEEFLRERGWILPVFPYFSAAGLWRIGERYSESVLDLVEGSKTSISVAQAKGQTADISEEEFRTTFAADFSGLLELVGDECRMGPTVPIEGQTSSRWLGSPSARLEILFGKIYDWNRETIAFAELRQLCEGDAEFDAFLGTTETSTFFKLDRKNETLRPRFLRKNIHLQVVTSVAWQLQRKLVRHHAASASRTTTIHGKRVYDYHDFSTLFDRDPEFLRKLCYLARQECSVAGWSDFEAVLVLDDGRQAEFLAQLRQTFRPESGVLRCLGPEPRMRLYPYEKLESGTRVLIICDVINSGDIASDLVTLAERHLGCEVEGVFAFILNKQLAPAVLRHRGGPREGQRVPARSLLVKPLESSTVAPPRSRFDLVPEAVAHAERFLHFWELVDRFGRIEQRPQRSDLVTLRSANGPVPCRREVSQLISLRSPRQEAFARQLVAGAKHQLGEKAYTHIFSNSVETAKTLGESFRDANQGPAELRVLCFSEAAVPEIKVTEGTSVLVVDDAANTFHNLRHMLERLREAGLTKSQIDAVLIFSRDASRKQDRRLLELEKTRCRDTCQLFVYYESTLPVYLLVDQEADWWTYSPLEVRRREWLALHRESRWDPDVRSAVREFLDDVPAVQLLEESLDE